MDTLMQALFIYACENKEEYSREDRRQFHASSRMAEEAQQEIIEMLPEKGQQRFKDYICAETALQTLELESLFRAGVAIGLELSRL